MANNCLLLIFMQNMSVGCLGQLGEKTKNKKENYSLNNLSFSYLIVVLSFYYV